MNNHHAHLLSPRRLSSWYSPPPSSSSLPPPQNPKTPIPNLTAQTNGSTSATSSPNSTSTSSVSSANLWIVHGVCEHDPIMVMKPMLQASFCLQPLGDMPTRRSTSDGIVAGCIPVFFEDLSAKKQYRWHLPEEEYNEFSVFIAKEDVVFKGLKIVDVLMSIPRSEVRRMGEKLVKMMPRLMYRKHGSSLGLRNKKDAFDIAVEGTLQSIKSIIKK